MFLSICTSSNICSVSLFNGTKTKSLEKNNVKDHSRYLATFSKKVLGEHYNKIDFIVVSIGPGSFAGIKSGVSFTKGLSLAIDKPIVPINNFDCMNQEIKYNGKYYICIYSHKDYVYMQLYDNNIKVKEPKCISIEKLEKYPIFGYGLSKIGNKKYSKINLNSKIIGEFALKKYENLLESNIDNIKPIYLEI